MPVWLVSAPMGGARDRDWKSLSFLPEAIAQTITLPVGVKESGRDAVVYNCLCVASFSAWYMVFRSNQSVRGPVDRINATARHPGSRRRPLRRGTTADDVARKDCFPNGFVRPVAGPCFRTVVRSPGQGGADVVA